MANLKNKNFKLLLLIISIVLSFNFSLLTAGVFEYSMISTVEDSDLQKAKDTAIKQARALALEYVIKRIVSKKYNKKIESLINIDNAALYDNSFSVSQENFSGKNYTANITYRFNSKDIYTLLDKNNIPYIKSNVQEYKTLVIPTFIPIQNIQESNQESVWSSYWSWQKGQDYVSSFMFYLPPNKDFLSKLDYISGVMNNLKVSGVYGLILKEVDIDNTLYYDLEIINYKTSNKINYAKLSSMNEAISLATQEMEEDLKNKTIQFMAKNNVSDVFKVAVKDYEEWFGVEKILNDLKPKVISNLDINKLDSNYVYIQIKHKHSIEDLKSLLMENCLFLDENSMSIYLVKNCP
jgi:hypothetical protein